MSNLHKKLTQAGFTVIAKLKLADDVIKAFVELGHEQRGYPEQAMEDIQKNSLGGVFDFLVEHVGDLTHRMSNMAEYQTSGREYVINKAEKVLVPLTAGYSFYRELEELMQKGERSKKIDPEQFQEKMKKLSLKYAQAHSKLIVYNHPQWLAREAAVALGEWDFRRATRFLKELLAIAKNEDKYDKEAHEVQHDSSGKILPYKKGI